MSGGTSAIGRASLAEPAKLRVFISYSRDDLDFADQLDIALDGTGFDATVDRHGIAGADNWKHRLGELIRDADTVVFVLSPSSARSDVCAWEVEEAARLGKRIIPVICRPLGATAAPAALADLNYIFYYAEPKSPGSGFGSGLIKLIGALNEDPAWLREHTRLLGLATHWDAAGRPASRLLSGDDIGKAKTWLTERRQTKTEPTTLHIAFIKASEDEAATRLGAERKRLDDMAAAQAERAQALEKAEKALSAAADAQRRRAHLRAALLVVMGLAAVIAGGLGYVALERASIAEQQRAEAQKQTAIAQTQKGEAERQRKDAEAAREATTRTLNEALLTQSKFLADLSRRVTEIDKDPGTGLLLALEALRDAKSDDPIIQNRPYWARGEASLEVARRHLRETAVLKGHDNSVTSVAWSPDGRRLATGSEDSTVRLWEASGDGGGWRETAVLKGHDNSVTSVAWSPDGRRLSTGARDKTVRLWEASGDGGGWRETAVLKGHDNSVTSVAWSPDGRRLSTGARDKTVRLWEASGDGGGWRETAVLKGHDNSVTSVAWSADGRRLVTGSVDRTVRLWEASGDGGGWRETAVLKGHDNSVTSVAWSPDGRRLATGSDDNTVRLWEASGDGGGWRETAVLKGHDNSVTSVAWSADGRRLAPALMTTRCGCGRSLHRVNI